jgi:hypothetical protein
MGRLERIRVQLDEADDPTLLILRTHLLIEERLREIVARICRSPDELPPAGLSFHQVLCLCRAVVGRHDEPAWSFAARLNEVHKRMAHNLGPGDLEELLGSIVVRVSPDRAARLCIAQARFCVAAISAYGYFDAIARSARLREAYGPEKPILGRGKRHRQSQLKPVRRAMRPRRTLR